MLVACGLVLVMTPALGFFYAGMVRKKNLLSTLTLSFVSMGLVSLQWAVVGYSLVFGPSHSGLLGGLKYLGLNGIGILPSAEYGPTIPQLLFATYQMMFATITPALITGAFVERVRFRNYLVFTIAWATEVGRIAGCLGLSWYWRGLGNTGDRDICVESD